MRRIAARYAIDPVLITQASPRLLCSESYGFKQMVELNRELAHNTFRASDKCRILGS